MLRIVKQSCEPNLNTGAPRLRFGALRAPNLWGQPHDPARFLKLLGYVAKGIQSGLFYPNPNFTCPSCPYRKHCDAWQDV